MQEYAPEVAVPPADASYEDCLAYCAGLEDAVDETHPLQLEVMPNFDHVEQSTETIQGPDGNDITLYIHRPKGADGPLPGFVNLHGGDIGMPDIIPEVHRETVRSIVRFARSL